MRTCSWCGKSVEEWCPHCSKAIKRRPKRERMTPDERETEMRRMDTAEVPFELMHARFEELIGRPVFTHEFGLRWEQLIAEARGDRPESSLTEVLECIPKDKRIIVPVVMGGKND